MLYCNKYEIYPEYHECYAGCAVSGYVLKFMTWHVDYWYSVFREVFDKVSKMTRNDTNLPVIVLENDVAAILLTLSR